MPYKNKEDAKECNRKYYIDHRDELLERMRGYRIKRKAEKPWTTHSRAAKQRCTDPNRKDFERYGGRGIEFKLTMKEVEYLYKRDKAQDMDCASIDRIYSDGNYVFGNCRFIESRENVRGKARRLICV